MTSCGLMDEIEAINAIELEIAYKNGFNKKQSTTDLQKAIHEYLSEHESLPKDHVFQINFPNVGSVMLCTEVKKDTPRSNLCLYSYHLLSDHSEEETIQQDGDEVQISNHWLLPSKEFHGLWESLVFEDTLKEDLLSFSRTTMLFTCKQVNTNLVTCNRLIVLHGPPGTGKTSLCKALAQKLSIRMTDHYSHAHLIEINSHSLFSKWFSESGKLVQKVFTQIHDLCQDRAALVCVLVDEVESIAFARDAISNNEPSDSIRVVNAVLTQLDQLRKHPNVFILATSNLTGSIDLAFLDRADIVQYIGPPGARAIYEIYRSALDDLQNVGIISDEECLPSFGTEGATTSMAAKNLRSLSEASVGLSGRSLRKVPFLAHALFVKQQETTLLKFISAMRNALRKMKMDKAQLNTKFHSWTLTDSGLSSEQAGSSGDVRN